MGILVLDDVLSNNVTVNTGNSFTLQHFDYKCERARSGAGNPFGTETPSYLHFTVKVADNVTGSEFLERMRQAETFSYSFLFNTDQAYTIVAYGYMVELEEIHDSVLLENGEEVGRKS